MKVSELIEELSKYPQGMEVWYEDSMYGAGPVSRVEVENGHVHLDF